MLGLVALVVQQVLLLQMYFQVAVEVGLGLDKRNRTGVVVVVLVPGDLQLYMRRFNPLPKQYLFKV
jgi:hypothetical protein